MFCEEKKEESTAKIGKLFCGYKVLFCALR